jgi:hypothetical protein
MDDEESSYAVLGEPLYRVETGNYEYRYDAGSLNTYFPFAEVKNTVKPES